MGPRSHAVLKSLIVNICMYIVERLISVHGNGATINVHGNYFLCMPWINDCFRILSKQEYALVCWFGQGQCTLNTNVCLVWA